MIFRGGQKVVCINDGPSMFTGLPTTVLRGKVYTVKRSWAQEFSEGGWANVLLLVEAIPGFKHKFFHADRFRPACERPTDISCFTELLNPTALQKVAVEIENALRDILPK